jgi:hypothetical protein
MHSRPWVRETLISEIRRDIWRYLTPAATIERELLEAAALLQLPVLELRTLGRLQFLVSDEVGELLAQLPFLVRHLATTTAKEEEWSAERVRGAIQWGRTLGVRQATGIPHLYVTAPARRAYQTPENELLVLLLEAIVSIGHRTGWHRSASDSVGKLLSSRVNQAERWLQVRALLEVERRPITGSKLARIRSGRHRRRYAAALSAYDRYRRLAEKLDRRTIREAVETNGLVTRDDATLFELLCMFRTLDALQRQGWNLGRLGLFQGALRIRGARDQTAIEVSYQTTPSSLSTGSVYRGVQQAHGLTPGGLRPDVVIRTEGAEGRRWLVVEVKGGHRPLADSARVAAYDLLAYRTAFGAQLAGQAGTYGLGIAWGSGLIPSFARPITLCTPDTLDLALEQLVY